MYAECPRCQALFRVTRSQLESAEGWVRCGECGYVFDAGETLSTPDEQAPPPPDPDSIDADDLFAGTDLDASEPEPTTEPLEPGEAPPSKRRRRRGGTLLWTIASLLLIALLGSQYLLSQREQFARHPELRPLLGQLCRVAGCTLPPLRNLADIELRSRNVFAHPNIPHALMITATMVNNASFPQPYPELQISFSNLEGRRVAMGRFRPAQYLPKDVNPHGLMPIGKPVHISFSVNDPGEQALAYEFSFR